jgi:hypothetical protein
MPNCNHELNRQLQGLEARIASAEENITSTYAGISQLVAGLAANPITLGSVTASLATFNFTNVGYTIMKKLVELLPGYDLIQQLQMLDAAALLETMADKLGATMVGAVNQAIDEATAALEGAVIAEAAYAAGVLAGTLSTPDLEALAVSAAEARLGYTVAKQLADNISGFLQAQVDIGTCKATSMSIDK